MKINGFSENYMKKKKVLLLYFQNVIQSWVKSKSPGPLSLGSKILKKKIYVSLRNIKINQQFVLVWRLTACLKMFFKLKTQKKR